MNRISMWLFVGGIASLFFRRGIFHPYFIQPFEILTAASALLAILSMIRQKYRAGKIDWPKTEILYWLKRFVLFFFLIAVGTAYAFLKYAINDQTTINLLIREATELFLYAIAFLLVFYHSRQKGFIAYALIAFLPNLGFALLILFPALHMHFSVIAEDLIIGFHTYRSTFGHLLIIVFTVCAALFAKANGWKKGLAWITAIIAAALVLWSGSRNGYLVMPLITLYIAYRTYRDSDVKRLFVFILKFSAISLSTLAIAFMMLPFTARNMVLYRFFPQFMFLVNTPKEKATELGLKTTDVVLPYNQEVDTNKIIVNSTATITTVETTELVKAILQKPELQVVDNRGATWGQALKLVVKSPLGLSTQFYSINKTIKSAEGIVAGGHNTFIQIALSSGWLGLVLFLWFWWTIFRCLQKSRDKSWEWLTISAIMGATFITLFFDDWLFAPWMWVIAGLAAAYQSKPVSDIPTSSDVATP